MTRIQIYDTTLRDGSQGEGINFSLQDKLLITRRLDELGFDYIEGGYPLSNPKDFEYFKEALRLPLRHARIVAFGMTRKKDTVPEHDACLKALLEARAPVLTIVGKTSDFHVMEVLGTSLDENLKMIADSVGHCSSADAEVFYDAEHYFDGLKLNRSYALQTLVAAQDAGARVIILCDTNGGSMPEEIAAGVQAARSVLKVPIGIHCHNDCDVAIANTLAAVRQGAVQVQGTINGIGERCGNADLISICANLGLKYGYEVLQPESLEKLTELSRYIYEIANMNFRQAQPFVGGSAFAHKGGMHAHAIARNPVSYEHIDPQTVGNGRRILLSELSGLATVLSKTNKLVKTADKALLSKLLSQVQDLENQGYEFEAAEASFDLLARKALGVYEPRFKLEGFRLNVEAEGQGQPVTEATVKIVVREQVVHTVSQGDGPVNALDSALRKALLPFFPNVAEMHLADYKVRVVNALEETAARVRVVIEWRDQHDVWGTVGVSENIIQASWLALTDSFEYKLFKDEEKDAHAD